MESNQDASVNASNDLPVRSDVSAADDLAFLLDRSTYRQLLGSPPSYRLPKEIEASVLTLSKERILENSRKRLILDHARKQQGRRDSVFNLANILSTAAIALVGNVLAGVTAALVNSFRFESMHELGAYAFRHLVPMACLGTFAVTCYMLACVVVVHWRRAADRELTTLKNAIRGPFAHALTSTKIRDRAGGHCGG